MLITFKSDASADVIMFGDVGRKLLAILGKDPHDTTGIVTVPQLPEAIQRLKAAIDADKAEQAARQAEADAADPTVTHTGMDAPVGLVQRAWPLLEALEYSARDGVPVIWQVS